MSNINHLFLIRESRIENNEMKKHQGMRPQDLVILLKIAAKGEQRWLMKDLSQELGISASEISESLNRSSIAGLIADDKRRLMKTAVLEFLQYGLRYVFPQKPGSIVRGMPTAHSAPPLNDLIQHDELFVWPWVKGEQRGQSIEPLYTSVPIACKRDQRLYELLALTDALRIGKVRERNLAIEELKKLL